MGTLQLQLDISTAAVNGDGGKTKKAAVPKVPTGTKLRRLRDALNAELFLETDPIVNGDVDVKDLCFDIRRTVESIVGLRTGDSASAYRIHFFQN